MVEKLFDEKQHEVFFFESDELFLFLDEQAAKEANREERVKGYRIKFQYQAVSDADKKRKRETVAQVIGQAFHRLKKDK